MEKFANMGILFTSKAILFKPTIKSPYGLFMVVDKVFISLLYFLSTKKFDFLKIKNNFNINL